jgi:hypothetical protein
LVLPLLRKRQERGWEGKIEKSKIPKGEKLVRQETKVKMKRVNNGLKFCENNQRAELKTELNRFIEWAKKPKRKRRKKSNPSQRKLGQ